MFNTNSYFGLNARGEKKVSLTWSQTNEHVIIELHVNNPRLEQCNYKLEKLEFELSYTRDSGSICVYEYTLFAEINPDETLLYSEDDKIVVMLLKVKPIHWPGLDRSSIEYEPDEEEFLEPVHEHKKKKKGLLQMATKRTKNKANNMLKANINI